MLSPCVPLLFMGEEYGEKNPFPYFCSFDDPALIEAVRRGRREEVAAIRFEKGIEIPDPQSPETFAAAKLSWSWPEGSPQAQLRQLYQDLLAARRQWPALRDRRHTSARLVSTAMWHDHSRPCKLPATAEGDAETGTVEGGLKADTAEGGCATRPTILLLERGGDHGRLLAVANLTAQTVPLAALELGEADLLLSTEDVRYGGDRRNDHSREKMFPHELLIFGSR
jgi:maltooligosyltrehalose trehalohydrolase